MENTNGTKRVVGLLGMDRWVTKEKFVSLCVGTISDLHNLSVTTIDFDKITKMKSEIKEIAERKWETME